MLLGSSVNAFVMRYWSKGAGRDEQIGVAAKWQRGGSSGKIADIYQVLSSIFLNEFIQLRDCFYKRRSNRYFLF